MIRSNSKVNTLSLLFCLLVLSRVAEGTPPSSKLPESVVSSEANFESKTSVGDVLLFPLKIPSYLLMGVTYPIRSFIEFNEEVKLIKRAQDFFSNEDQTIWLYPTLGFSTSDGFSYGAKFEHNEFFSDEAKNLEVDISHNINDELKGGISYEEEGPFEFLTLSGLSLEYSDNKNEKFFGFGSFDSDFRETIYRKKQSNAQIQLSWNLIDQFEHLRLIGEVGYKQVETSTGQTRNSKENSEDVFAEINNLGFDRNIEFASYSIGFEIDRLAPKGLPSRGDKLLWKYTRNEHISSDDFDFNRVEIEAAKVFPLLRRTRMLVFAVDFEHVFAGEGQVPFFELASLGKNGFLRGFDPHRFRDNYALSGTLEYRYPVWMTYSPDFAYGLARLFIDAGKSFSTLGSFGGEKLETSYGLGFMIAAPRKFLVNTELAVSREGFQFTISLNRKI